MVVMVISNMMTILLGGFFLNMSHRKYLGVLVRQFSNELFRDIALGDKREAIISAHLFLKENDQFLRIRILRGRSPVLSVPENPVGSRFPLSSLAYEKSGMTAEFSYSVTGFIFSTSVFALVVCLVSVLWYRHLSRRIREEYLENEEKRRHEIIASTTAQIAHDLKGPLGIFQKIAFGTAADFESDRDRLRSSLQKLFSMTESIKRADSEGIVRPAFTTELDLMENINEFKPFAERTGTQLHLEGNRVLKRLVVDAEKLNRAIGNLLLNGCESGGPSVVLSSERSGNDLIIRVSDDGQGVPPTLASDLFKRGTSGKENGTGMGLAFVRHVARGHGGEAAYLRRDNRSIFEIRLAGVFESDRAPDLSPVEKPRRLKRLIVLSNRADHQESYRKGLPDDVDVARSIDPGDLSSYAVIFSEMLETDLSPGPDQQLIILPEHEDIPKRIRRIRMFHDRRAGMA